MAEEKGGQKNNAPGTEPEDMELELDKKPMGPVNREGGAFAVEQRRFGGINTGQSAFGRLAVFGDGETGGA